MQLKEFEAWTLKECLQQVRDDLGPDAVILETRKVRKGGLLGWGTREAVCIVAATGITVKSDVAAKGKQPQSAARPQAASNGTLGAAPGRSANSKPATETNARRDLREAADANGSRSVAATASQAAAVAAARNAYSRAGGGTGGKAPQAAARPVNSRVSDGQSALQQAHTARERDSERPISQPEDLAPRSQAQTAPVPQAADGDRFAFLERAMREIRDSLNALKREQQETSERTVSAVVSAVAPAVSAVTTASQLVALADAPTVSCPELYNRLAASGVSEALCHELIDSLPDLNAWSEPAQLPLATSALRDLIGRRVSSCGPISLTPGQLKAVALIGPTGVGKTTTIAKLAAHFALVEKRRVALLTVDTYRIAAVEQLKTYSQIIDIPIGVAYSQSEVMPVVEQFADYDLLLIDTAGRSQKNIMQVGELKSLLEVLNCETHLVLSASTKEQDMLEAAQRFSGARVDRLIFSKLDETSTYGTLLNVADSTGIPLSYLTTGQKVPEDIEIADGAKLAQLLLDDELSNQAVLAHSGR